MTQDDLGSGQVEAAADPAPTQEEAAVVSEAEPQATLPEWASAIDTLARTPVAGADPAGEKLFDQPDYEALDAEIKKPQAMQPEPVEWNRVDQLSRTLLETSSKDVKVAGFLAVSLVERQGVRGQAMAAVLLAGLAETFGGELWPRRKRARAGAIEWMGERLLASAEGLKARGNDLVALTAAASGAKAALAAMKQAFEEDSIEELRLVRKWSDAIEARRRDAERAQSKPDAASAKAESHGGGAETKQSIESPADARAALTSMRKTMEKAARVLRGADATDVAAYRVHRFAQWPDKVAFEFGADGKTPIPMLEPAAAEALLRTFESERDEGVLNRLEAAFAERPFWLDLQRILAQTMEAFGPRFDGARGAVAGATSELVQREPRLLTATFANGVPFAGPATAMWLEAASGTGTARPRAKGDGESSSAADEIEERARAAAAKGDLRGALTAFQEGLAGPGDLKTRFRLRLALAQVCVQNGHPAIALPHLAELREDLSVRTVGEWAPELAIDVLAASVEALRKEAKARGKAPEIQAQAAEALSELSRLDPLRALELDA